MKDEEIHVGDQFEWPPCEGNEKIVGIWTVTTILTPIHCVMRRESDGREERLFPLQTPFVRLPPPPLLPPPTPLAVQPGDRFEWPDTYPCPSACGVWVAIEAVEGVFDNWKMVRESDGQQDVWVPLHKPFIRLPMAPAPPTPVEALGVLHDFSDPYLVARSPEGAIRFCKACGCGDSFVESDASCPRNKTRDQVRHGIEILVELKSIVIAAKPKLR